MLYKVKMTPRQLATLHKWCALDGRDGREFATILIDVEEDDGPTPALLVGQGEARARIPHGGPAEELA